MIQVYISLAGVERVVFDADSEIEEDFDFAAWQVIRSLIDRIDERLRGLENQVERRWVRYAIKEWEF